jgi:hypothetical protein
VPPRVPSPRGRAGGCRPAPDIAPEEYRRGFHFIRAPRAARCRLPTRSCRLRSHSPSNPESRCTSPA